MSNTEPQQQQQDDEGFPLGLIDEIMIKLPLWGRNHILFNWGERFTETSAQDPAIIEMFGTITTLNFNHYRGYDDFYYPKKDTKFPTLAKLPFTPRLAHLNLSHGGHEPVQFLSHPIFQHLVTLDLSSTRLKSLDPLFLDTPHNFPNLRDLNLSWNNDLQISTHVNSNKFPQLKVLNLQNVRLGTSILAAFLSQQLPPLPQMSSIPPSVLSPPQIPTNTATVTPVDYPQHPSFRLEKLILNGSYPPQPLPTQLFNSPCLSQLQELTLKSFKLDVNDINTLLGEDIDKIKHLTLLDLGLSPFASYDAFKALTQSPCLSNLHTLFLNGRGLSPPSSSPESTALEVLFKSPYLWTSKLKHFDVCNSFTPLDSLTFGDTFIARLANANVHFEIFRCDEFFPTFDQLTTSPCFSQLKQLPFNFFPKISLSDDEDLDTTAERLAQSPNISNLTFFQFPFLNNGDLQWTYDQMATLLTSPMMSNDVVDFLFPPSDLDFDIDGLVEILTTTRVVPGDETSPLKYGKLQKLYLSSTCITSRGIDFIVRNLTQLTRLDLMFCKRIDDAAITALISHEHDDPRYPYPVLPHLTLLNLSHCPYTDEGYITLSKSQLLDQLENLYLANSEDESNIESNDGAEAILRTRLFSNMKSLQIYVPFPHDLDRELGRGYPFENCKIDM